MQHVNKLVEQCKEQRKKQNRQLQWHGSKQFNTIATTTRHPDPKKLHFEPIGQLLEDDKNRRNYLQSSDLWRRFLR